MNLEEAQKKVTKVAVKEATARAREQFGHLWSDLSVVTALPTALLETPCVCVVPTGNNNRHEYELNQPVVVVSPLGCDAAREQEWVGQRENGTVGNALPSYANDLRLATSEEIDAFFKVREDQAKADEQAEKDRREQLAEHKERVAETDEERESREKAEAEAAEKAEEEE